MNLMFTFRFSLAQIQVCIKIVDGDSESSDYNAPTATADACSV